MTRGEVHEGGATMEKRGTVRVSTLGLLGGERVAEDVTTGTVGAG